MDRAVFDSVEREVEHEVHKRFPGDAVRRAVLLRYGDDPEIERDLLAWKHSTR
jgi:hypothetical protein